MNAEPRCELCRSQVVSDAVARRRMSSGPDGVFHGGCWDKVRSGRRRRALNRVEHIISALPVWVVGTNVGSEEFARCISSARLRHFAATYTPERGSALLSGKSGTGKTTAVAFAVLRIVLSAVDAAVDGAPEQLDRAASIVWARAVDVSTAIRAYPLGQGEPTLISRARSASLFVIDDLGREPTPHGIGDPIFRDLIDDRYMHALPTVVSTGLPRKEFAIRYGDDQVRRLTERGRGRLIEVRDDVVEANDVRLSRRS